MTKELTAQDNLDSIPNPMDDAFKAKGIDAEYMVDIIWLFLDKLKGKGEKKRIALKRLLNVSKEARSWVELVVRLLNLMPAEKKELSGSVTLEQVVKDIESEKDVLPNSNYLAL